MKLRYEILERGRIREGHYASSPGEDYGAFQLEGPKGQSLRIIAFAGDDEVAWEHVSVSLANRCPNWEEMCWVKSLFWDDEEVVMQLHPPKSQWINTHPYCLHLWRPLKEVIPLPPQIAV